MKFLRRLCFALVYILPAILFFSYYPIISLGNDATMNFEFSLPLIWLILFDLVAFLNLLLVIPSRGFRHFPKPSREEQAATTERGPRKDGRPNGAKKSRRKSLMGISDRKFFLFALFPLYATLSIFWSANPLRAVLTAGVIWLLFFAVFALIFVLPLLNPDKRFSHHLIMTFFISTAVVCVFCWLQCLLDVLGASRDATLLCLGCTSWTFGFPHPSGFAIEPQYMGNLLLAPTLLALYLLVFKSHSQRQWLGLLAFASFFSATLFLTLSRGAIYAYAIALVILLVFALLRSRKSQSYLIIAIPIATFLGTLAMQGIFATISPTADDFYSGTTKVIHQLSLGIIDLRPQAVDVSDDMIQSSDSVSVENPVENSQDTDVSASKFDGYIPASTNVRLGLSGVALQTWPESPILGVGLGGAGVAISRSHPENELAVPNAIVQNEPISLLLELGLVGIMLILLAFWLAFGPQSEFWQNQDLPLFLALIIAYLVTLQFFSGPANALQIYLVPPLLYMALARAHSS